MSTFSPVTAIDGAGSTALLRLTADRVVSMFDGMRQRYRVRLESIPCLLLGTQTSGMLLTLSFKPKATAAPCRSAARRERTRVPWLVKSELAAAGQPERRHQAEALIADVLGELDPLVAQRPYRRTNVLAHQIQLVVGGPVGGMGSELGWPKGEDQPPAARIGASPARNVNSPLPTAGRGLRLDVATAMAATPQAAAPLLPGPLGGPMPLAGDAGRAGRTGWLRHQRGHQHGTGRSGVSGVCVGCLSECQTPAVHPYRGAPDE